MATHVMFGTLTRAARKAVSAKRTEDAIQVPVGLSRLPHIEFRTAPAVGIDKFDRLAASRAPG